MQNGKEEITVQDIISKRKEHSRRVDTKLISQALRSKPKAATYKDSGSDPLANLGEPPEQIRGHGDSISQQGHRYW